VHLLASKDQSGFNAGMFFIKVHDWSIRTLTQAMTYEWHKPELDLSFLEQTSLYHEMNHTANRAHVLYQPRKWFNTYEFHHAYEGQRGDMFVHFPGLQEDRWAHMEKWLEILEGPKQAEWEVPLEETTYPAEIEEFWSQLDVSERTLRDGRERVEAATVDTTDLKAALERLETVLWAETDQIEALRMAAAEVHDIVKATMVG
jgi:lipopolysaccharide biosynthesis glycosyltransferase